MNKRRLGKKSIAFMKSLLYAKLGSRLMETEHQVCLVLSQELHACPIMQSLRHVMRLQ